MVGSTVGGVRVLLRLEGACVLVAALVAYSHVGAGWTTFAWCFLLPDLAFLGYLAGPRVGALAYNTTHSYVGAVLALLAGVLGPRPELLAAGVIWSAHIGMDRALGYGLKYASGFGATHLGLIGKARRDV
jgi:hypothetical protein